MQIMLETLTSGEAAVAFVNLFFYSIYLVVHGAKLVRSYCFASLNTITRHYTHPIVTEHRARVDRAPAVPPVPVRQVQDGGRETGQKGGREEGI